MTLTNDLDARALTQVAAGQPSALLELYDRYAARLFAAVYEALRDPTAAEDVVQETFTAAWFEVRSWFNAPRDVYDWLMDIARARLAIRPAEPPAPAPLPASMPASLPRALRDRVLDSIYGAGDRLRPPFATPQWARQFNARWIVWLLAAGEALLIFALA